MANCAHQRQRVIQRCVAHARPFSPAYHEIDIDATIIKFQAATPPRQPCAGRGGFFPSRHSHAPGSAHGLLARYAWNTLRNDARAPLRGDGSTSPPPPRGVLRGVAALRCVASGVPPPPTSSISSSSSSPPASLVGGRGRRRADGGGDARPAEVATQAAAEDWRRLRERGVW